MAENILHQKCLRTSIANLQINEEMYNEALILIEDIVTGRRDSRRPYLI